MRRRPTIKRLRQVLAYEPVTGVLRWRIDRRRVRAGSKAGSRDRNGYVRVTIDGFRLQAHVVIWAMVTGRWPVIDIDHHDTKRSNNRWNNLRKATDSQNKANGKLRSDNTSGFKGAYRHGRRWVSKIGYKGRVLHLGMFDEPQAAHAAYFAKAIELFGSFARSS